MRISSFKFSNLVRIMYTVDTSKTFALYISWDKGFYKKYKIS
jgi:hypothetical protein